MQLSQIRTNDVASNTTLIKRDLDDSFTRVNQSISGCEICKFATLNDLYTVEGIQYFDCHIITIKIYFLLLYMKIIAYYRPLTISQGIT